MKKISGTKEWAKTNVNIQKGCAHDCKYYYAKCMALRFRRTTVEPWKHPKLAPHKLKTGFQTSVSCEPMLDDRISDVVRRVTPFVTDAIWIGKANRLRLITKFNCPNDAEVRRRVDSLIAMQNDASIWSIYDEHSGCAKIKWKESIKDVIGLPRPKEPGLDE